MSIVFAVRILSSILGLVENKLGNTEKVRLGEWKTVYFKNSQALLYPEFRYAET